MTRVDLTYRPPDTDSEEDYDGFLFGDSIIVKSPTKKCVQEDPYAEIMEIIGNGDWAKLKDRLDRKEVTAECILDCRYTILSFACKEGQVEIVRKLLEECSLNPNWNVDGNTPLIVACASTHPTHRLEIVRLLVQFGAQVNVAKRQGITPLIEACQQGAIDVVEYLLTVADVDATDANGCTALFHATEANQLAIVEKLMAAGANDMLANRKGYTPRKVAEDRGFDDLLALLPPPAEPYRVPAQHLSYGTLRDFIPQIFLKSDCPEYFQDIYTILQSLNMTSLLEYFDRGKVSLAEFLVSDDARLKELGIELPLYRMKIQKVLLDFHLNHWSVLTIAAVSRTLSENYYEILMIAANHLQNLVIITSSLRFVKAHLKRGEFGHLSMQEINSMRLHLKTYSNAIKELHKVTKYLASFSPPKSPLYIDYDEFLAERKRSKIRKVFKCTTLVIGISVVICLKMKNFF